MADIGTMKRGAIASPRYKLAATAPHLHVAGSYPPAWTPIPSQLSYWLNDNDRDCVSAEAAAAIAVYSVAAGLPEIFIPDASVQAFIRKYGYANGASLTEVMDTMEQVGLLDSAGVARKEGPYKTVDWTDYPTMCSAIYQGPVKLGVAADQIERSATPGKNGWIMLTASKDRSIDHCINASQYGTLGELCEAFKVSVPAGENQDIECYGEFTWKSFGIVAATATVPITGEAWLRSPTTDGVFPPAPVIPNVPPAPVGQ